MNTSLRRHVGALAALALVALVGAGSATAVATARADVDGPDYQRPVVGECHDYAMKTTSALADGSATVPCTQKHTARAIAVLDLPDDLSWEDEAADEDAFYADLYASGALVPCATALRKALGANYAKIRRTAYNWTFYRPTNAQVNHGARWLRCDVNLFGGKKLQALSRGSSVKIGTISKAEQACRLVVGRSTTLTGCTSKHDYRVVKIVRVPGTKLPSYNKLMKLAAKKCEPATGPYWWASWPTETTWADGDRILSCSRPTRR